MNIVEKTHRKNKETPKINDLDQKVSSFVHSKANPATEALNKTKYVRDYLENQLNRSAKKENKKSLKNDNYNSNTHVQYPLSRILLEKNSNEKGIDFALFIFPTKNFLIPKTPTQLCRISSRNVNDALT